MYDQEEIKPYDSPSAKGEQVEHMFDAIASRYDMLNHWMSLDIDKRWRRVAIRQLAPYRPQEILDIATGTGDFAIQTAKMLSPRHLIGADISEGMMAIGREKVSREGLSDVISFDKEDCLSLSYPDSRFDAVTAAFGIRNFADLDRGLREMCRVLRPGGHLSIVELTHPVSFPMKQLFRVYSHTVLPLWGRLVSKDERAYRYLTATIEAFPQGEEMTGILTKAGFREASFRRMTFGVCTMYFATK
ncbi:MAG: bifunctional demethylmenaquinone methyltransferase/2-methoxy-6-polyprenyl-1,4-benzoquinol methylase UbiE [Prevotella sp.]|nr:bifunctional demethylmenaquinone methyltransferase/2-methoxy-6-polyprenyl-1,4-benzoquinol methylase UbiE [Prevotella sp.]